MSSWDMHGSRAGIGETLVEAMHDPCEGTFRSASLDATQTRQGGPKLGVCMSACVGFGPCRRRSHATKPVSEALHGSRLDPHRENAHGNSQNLDAILFGASRAPFSEPHAGSHTATTRSPSSSGPCKVDIIHTSKLSVAALTPPLLLVASFSSASLGCRRTTLLHLHCLS